MMTDVSLSTIVPFIDIESAEFAKQYELGITWRLYGDEQGQGPVPASYLVTNLQRYAEHDYFNTNDSYHLSHLGFFLGMYHGGILSPQTGQCRSDVTTLAHLDHRDARRGYRAGREFYFSAGDIIHDTAPAFSETGHPTPTDLDQGDNTYPLARGKSGQARRFGYTGSGLSGAVSAVCHSLLY